MSDRTEGWRANWVDRGPDRELFVYREWGGDRQILVPLPGTSPDQVIWEAVTTRPAVDSGLATMRGIPWGAANAIIQASADIGEGGRASEIRVLREWLDKESERLDALMMPTMLRLETATPAPGRRSS